MCSLICIIRKGRWYGPTKGVRNHLAYAIRRCGNRATRASSCRAIGIGDRRAIIGRVFSIWQISINTFSEVAKVGATEKTIAQLEITGMMCEVGCVAKVKKELLAQAGVSNVKIDFEKGREFNFASIEYDPLNCDAKSLSSVVNAIADGKLYGVKSVEVTHFAPAAASSLE